ncbi:MAG: metal ABC transporter substrate-binding protein [Planctomycetota bacterium]|nr:metal ABC transporter substrate-binding protein [Planctomycetota bacterium]
MQRFSLIGLHVLFVLAALVGNGQASPLAQGPVKAVATLPDIADLVREIGGDRVEVKAICKGTENVHAVRLKPSHVVMTSRCEAFFQVGLSLEHAWVPGLIKTSRNRKIQAGQPGLVTVSEGMTVLEKPASLSRKEGADIHPEGNPHVNLAHGAGRHMAARIRDSLVELRPKHKAEFEARFKAFEAKSKAAEIRWTKLAAQLKDKKVIVYHSEFNYLLEDLGLEVLATIEPKPGVPPTPGHLAKVIQIARKHPKAVVLTAAWSNNRAVDRVVDTCECCKLVLASMAVKEQSWLDSMEDIHRSLANAFEVAYPSDEASDEEGAVPTEETP